jgi:hypothetical protein
VRSYDTIYRRQRFRSRLEARWAAFFDRIGWCWEYEPFDADGYIPDFAVLGKEPLLVEVKPEFDLKSLQGYCDRIERAVAPHWKHDVLIVGATVYPVGETWFRQCPPAGILGQRISEEREVVLCWDPGGWAGCDCRYPASVFHTVMGYRRNPCGFYDGGHVSGAPVDLADRWRDAGAAVRWERPQATEPRTLGQARRRRT